MPLRIRPLLIGLGLVVTACATPGPLLTTSVGTLRTGLGEAGQQSAQAFSAANTAALAIDVDRVLARPTPNLAEADFPLAIASEDAARWANAFAGLDAYLAALQSLVDPARAAQTADTLDAIAVQLGSGPAALKLPAEATGAFSSFAAALVQAKAERSAQAIMRSTDPQFTLVMAGMAEAIGNDPRSGLRGTMRAYWEGKLADIRAAYAKVTGSDAAALAQRRAIIGQFTRAIAERDSALADLGGLQTSLLALGEAHAAAARGDPGDARFWVGRIGGWLDEARRRSAKIKAEIEAAEAARQDKP